MKLRAVLVMSTAILVAVVAQAASGVYNHWKYTTYEDDGRYAVINGYESGLGHQGDVSTPASVNVGGYDYTVRHISGIGGNLDCETLTVNGNGDTVIAGGAFDGSKLHRAVLKGVSRIEGSYAFRNCHNLEEVKFEGGTPDFIGYCAFEYCENLKSFKVPDTVGSIDSWAFEKCTSLAELDLGCGITNLAGNVFNGCSKLVDVVLPDSLVSCGNDLFANCGNITNFVIGSGLKRVTKGFTPYNSTNLVTVTVDGNGDTVIAGGAFDDSKLHRAVLKGVSRIEGSYAFRNCHNLEEVKFEGGTPDFIGYCAFECCENLKSFKVPDTVTKIDSWAFEGCTSLTELDLGCGITNLADNVFNGCSKLVDVVLPDSLVSCGNDLFANCGNITNFVIGSGLKLITKGFTPYNSTNLVTVTVNGSGDTVIAGGAFDGSKLHRAVLKGVSRIDSSYALRNCHNLEEVKFEGGTPDFIGYCAFECCENLKSFKVPDTVTKIDSWAFEGCTSLTELDLGCGITNLADNVFNGCSKLVDVVLPDSLVSCGNDLFANCGNITNFVVGSGLKLITKGFTPYNSTNLVTVTVNGNGDTVIAGGAFDGSKLHRAVLKGVSRIDSSYAFRNCHNLEEVKFEGGTPDFIGYCAFEYCENLKSFTVPDTVTKIDGWAFEGCSLKWILFTGNCPEGLEGAALDKQTGAAPTLIYEFGHGDAWRELKLKLKGINIVEAPAPEPGRNWNENTDRDWKYATDVEAHSGVISGDQVWTTNRTHVVYGWVTVAEGASLTVERGAVVKFCTGCGIFVWPGSKCDLSGVTLTHVADLTIGGDSLRDGGEKLPVVGAYAISGEVIDDDFTEYRYQPQELATTITGTVNLPGHNVYTAKDSVTIEEGAVLNLRPGTVIKFPKDCAMIVKGTLNARGERSDPVVFTSEADDDWGGDTNGDGEKTLPGPGDWHQIDVIGTANFEHALLLYGSSQVNYGCIEAHGGAIEFDNSVCAHTLYECVNAHGGGSFTARNSVFHDTSLGFGYYGGNKVKAYNCVFDSCTTAIRQSGKVLVNCVFSRCKQFTDQGGDGSDYQYCLFYNPKDFGAGEYVKVGSNGNIWGDPLFADPDNLDFSVPVTSPCVDAANGTLAPETDFFGSPRMNTTRADKPGVPDAKGVYPDIGIFEVSGDSGEPQPDLAVVSVTVPATATVGGRIEIVYTVTNRGEKAAIGTVHDAVRFHGVDAALGGVVVDAGEVSQYCSIEPGKAARFSMEITVPALAGGSWRVRLMANAERDIYEEVMANNYGEAAGVTVVSLPAIAAGSKTQVQVPALGETAFRITGLAASAGAVVFSHPDGVSAFAAVGFVPNAMRKDVEMTELADGRVALIMPEHAAEDAVYVTFAESAGRDCTLAVEVLASSAGLVPAKPKDVEVTTRGPNVVASLTLPSAIRDGRIYAAYVEYSNTGDQDAEMPIFVVTRKDSGTLLSHASTGDFAAAPITLLGLAPTAPRGVLKSGEAGRAAFYIRTQGALKLELSMVSAESVSKLNGFDTPAAYSAAMSAAATRLCARGAADPTFTDVLAQALNEKRGAGGGSVCGRLVHEVTRLPMPGYRIKLVCTNDASTVATATSDEKGAFALATTQPGDYILEIDGVQGNDEEVYTISGSDITGQTVGVVPYSAIEGFVFAAGMPVASAKVVIDDLFTEQTEDGAVLTDSNGHYRFAAVPDGDFRLIASPIQGYAAAVSDVVTVTNGAATAVVLEYTSPGVTVNCKLTEDEQTFAKGKLCLVDYERNLRFVGEVNEKGECAFDGVPEGKYQLLLEATGKQIGGGDLVTVSGSEPISMPVKVQDADVFSPSQPVGMITPTTPFEPTMYLLKQVENPRWDFDGDGKVDSTEPNPRPKFTKAGTYPITLVYFDPEANKDKTCVIADAVEVIDHFDNVLQDNGRLIDGDKLKAEDFDPREGDELVLSGEDAAKCKKGDVIGLEGDAEHIGFIEKITEDPKPQGDGSFRCKVEPAEHKDLCKEYFVAKEFKVSGEELQKQAGSALERMLSDNAKKDWSYPLNLGIDLSKINAGSSITLGGALSKYHDYVVGSFGSCQLKDGRSMTWFRQNEFYEAKFSAEFAQQLSEAKTSFKSKRRRLNKRVSNTIQGPGFNLGYGFYLSCMLQFGLDLSLSSTGKVGFEKCMVVRRSVEVTNDFNDRIRTRVLDWGTDYDPVKVGVSGSIAGNADLYAATGIFLSWPPSSLALTHAGGGAKLGFNVGIEQSISADTKDGLDSKLALTAELYAQPYLSYGLGSSGSAYSKVHDLPWKFSMPGSLSVGKLGFECDGEGLTVNFKANNPKTVGEGLLERYNDIDLGASDHSWKFGDKSEGAKGEEVTHTFPKPGRYLVTMTAFCNYPASLLPQLNGDWAFWKYTAGKIDVFEDGPPHPQKFIGLGERQPKQSNDPNEMVGPAGTGDRRYVEPGAWMDYTIYFENKASAEAPAQEIRVTNQLSPYLDWSTFEMLDIGFCNQAETALSGKQNAQALVAQKGTDCKVQLNVSLDKSKGVASWYLRSYDESQAELGYWPEDIATGVLPPNDGTHRGEGYITYRVKVREDAPKNAVIINSAEIVFDYNDPIETDPAWWNTVFCGRDLAETEDDTPFTGNATYNGWVRNAKGEIAGLLTIKAAKPGKKDNVSKLTVSYAPVGGKKQTIKLASNAMPVAGKVAMVKLDGIGTVRIGGRYITGVNGLEVQMAKDMSKSKNVSEKGEATSRLASMACVRTFAFGTGSGYAGFTVTIDKKGKGKLAGQLPNGAKVSVSSQGVLGGDSLAIPFVFGKKTESMAFVFWVNRKGQAEISDMSAVRIGGAVVAVDEPVIGPSGVLRSGARFGIDGAALVGKLGGTRYLGAIDLAQYLPNGLAVAANGAKWVVAGGAKTGKVAINKAKDGIDEAKLGQNPSALKLTYAAKTGAFKGSFKASTLVGGKLKSESITVTGVLVNGIGYGSASVKKKGSVPVVIE